MYHNSLTWPGKWISVRGIRTDRFVGRSYAFRPWKAPIHGHKKVIWADIYGFLFECCIFIPDLASIYLSL